MTSGILWKGLKTFTKVLVIFNQILHGLLLLLQIIYDITTTATTYLHHTSVHCNVGIANAEIKNQYT